MISCQLGPLLSKPTVRMDQLSILKTRQVTKVLPAWVASLQYNKPEMEADIVMDRRISYEMFLVRCFGCIISSRLNPSSQGLMRRHINSLTQKLKRRKESFEPLMLEVYLKTLSKQSLKIEEWIFTPTSYLEQSMQSMNSQTSSQAPKNKNIFGCSLSEKVYKQMGEFKPEFNLVLDKQLATRLEGQNVFEAPIDYLEFETFNCIVSLIYNYDLEEFQEEEFHVLSPDSPVRKVEFRKYSQGLEQVKALVLKTQPISDIKVKDLIGMADRINFQGAKDTTAMSVLDYLGLR